MKKMTRSIGIISGVVLALAFGSIAHAEGPRDEIVHAYILLSHANADYNGHKAAAEKELSAVGRSLGLHLEGVGNAEEHQWKSDRKLEEARRLLKDASEKLEDRDRDRAADHLDHAIHEIDVALKDR